MDQNRKQQPSPLKYSIRTRLILLFIISIIFIFFVAGYYLLWEISATLDKALGKNLEAMAKVIAQEIDPNFLVYLQPGDARGHDA
jgi:sensor histidine kinase regulating citrate/malate metabolism